MKQLFIVLIFLLLPSLASAQVVARVPARTNVLPEFTVANLPPAPPKGTVVIVTDGNTAKDCTTGTGSTRVQCHWTGSAWLALGDGAGTADHGDLAGNLDDDHTQYVIDSNAASTPAAGSCTRAGEMYTDTTTASAPVAYVCGGASETPRNIGAQGDAYNQCSDGTNSCTASGSETLRFARATALATEVEAFDLSTAYTNQPANDGVEILSSAAGDTTQTFTVMGTTNGGDASDIVIETGTLNGTTFVATTKTDWGNILALKLSATAVGTVTLREASADATITTIAIGATRSANQGTVFYKASGGGTAVKRLCHWDAKQGHAPATLFATLDTIAGTSAPAEVIPILEFDPTTIWYMDFRCQIPEYYASGGFTVTVYASNTTATLEVVWSGAFRTVEDDTEDLDTTVHSYAYNNSAADTVGTVIGEVVKTTFTFTDGADSDEADASDYVIFRLRRFATDSGDDNTGVGQVHLVPDLRSVSTVTSRQP